MVLQTYESRGWGKPEGGADAGRRTPDAGRRTTDDGRRTTDGGECG